METLRYAALLLLAVGLFACSSTPEVPATAARTLPGAPGDLVARSVGNLRRLAALPVVIDQGSCTWPEVARDLDESSIRFLRDWKGYELVRPAQLDSSWNLARKLGEWQEDDVGKGKPPSELRAQIVATAKDSGAGGVLVIHASPECPGGADAGLLTLPARLAESLNRTLSAGIYEAERGTLVWHQHIRPPGWDPIRYGSRPPPRFETRQAAEALFGPIENAVPAVLRPPRAEAQVPAETPAAVVTPAKEATPLVPVPTTPAPDATPSTPATGPGAATPPPPPTNPAAPQAPGQATEPPASGAGAVPQLPAPEAPAIPTPPEASRPVPASAPPAAPIRI
jgi:hypothetical protein